ncbi:MAG TPA: oligosaccharide flippase family protein [Pseudomonadales bacterium]|nr:oligosaccharide flippase family protein [Pseudomonadales bacterium]
MSLKKNITANYFGQIYATLIGIVMVPLYIKYMGAEAYGLVGFFGMLQAWFNLLDIGLTPTMARESARFHGGAISALDYRRIARALEGVFVLVALLGGLLLFVLSGQVAARWLNANQLPLREITSSLQLMAVIAALRWMGGLYRGVITGAEKLVWLSGFNSLIATLRFVLIVPVLIFVSASPLAFFGFQLAVAVIESVGLVWMSYRLLPAIPPGQRIEWEWAPLRPVLKFSLSIAFTSSAWVLVTQTDKLVLSKILPLADYGYFTVAVLVANGVMVLGGPITSALIPRMARLEAEAASEQLIALYRKGTQLVTMVCGSVGLFICVFAKPILWTWTGDNHLTEFVAPILSLYALGNTVLSFSAFPGYLQYAKGNLRLHVLGNLLYFIFLLPSMVWAALTFGVMGVGTVWLIINSAYFLCWTPLVHAKFLPGLHFSWLCRDVFRILLPSAFSCFLVLFSMNFSVNRIVSFFQLVGSFACVVIASAIFSSDARKFIANKLLNRAQ